MGILYITDDLSFSTIIPIPKGKHLNYSDSTNYTEVLLLAQSSESCLIYMYYVAMNRFALRLIYSLVLSVVTRHRCVP